MDKSIDTTYSKKEEAKFIKDRKLKDKYFIGCFNKTESGYLISDIRRSDFSKIKYKPKGSKSFTISVKDELKSKLQDNCYYKFTWVMLQSSPNYVFGVNTNEDIIAENPKDIVNLLYNDIYDYPASASEKIVNTLDTLKNQLTASGKEVFIYELLQNANDYPQILKGKKLPVDVEFHITDNYLIFQHSGDYFDAKNVAAICSINDKEKTDNAEAIGYKGIGFKTVFLDNQYVLLRTGDYQFRFDYEHTKNIEDTPWQILPIWTENKEVAREVLNVMNNADDKYRVQIALCPTDSEILHDGEQNYEALFTDVFDTERVILFIPFVNSVSVYMNGENTPRISRIKESKQWCVSESKKYVGDVPKELTIELNRRIDKNDGKIPEKYYNFRKTSVGFACRREGNKLLKVDNACLYCYLPAKKAKFGFGFLMNTDMIPTGPRDNVEPKENINHAIAKIAGEQFFFWIRDLLLSSQYDFDSIFSLIPDFDSCKEKYEEDDDVVKFIEEFQDGFESCLDNNEIIPVEIDGQVKLMPLEKINYDQVGITCANIISDEKLLEITDWCDYFPHPSLRDYSNKCLKPNIYAFLDTYAYENCLLNLECIKEACSNDAFQGWLQDQNNNDNFLSFLLDKQHLNQFKDKPIFLTEDKYLMAAEEIYEDIDIYYPNLTAFDDYLPRLSKNTRKYFADNEAWSEIKEDMFRNFNGDEFVDDELLNHENYNDTIERLKKKSVSICFYDFLSNHVVYSSKYLKLPIFDFRDNIINNFNNTICFYHKDGEELYDENWVADGWINLISEEYSEKTLAYLKENFGVKDFTLADFIKNTLFTDDARKYIGDLGNEHKDFVHYCFEHKDSFAPKSLYNFSLWTYDKEEENAHILSEDNIFFQNDLMKEFQSKTWIGTGWMYQLDEFYFECITDVDSFRKFLIDKFGVQEFSNESFYKNVVSKHIDDICSNIGGTSSDSDTDESIDVLEYLGQNYKLIFEENSGDKFVNLPLYRYDVWDEVTDRNIDVYMYDEELKNLLENSWTPEEFVYMLEDRYTEIFDKYPSLKKKLEIKTYSFNSIKDALLKDIDTLRDSIDDKEQSVACHRFMVNHIEELSTKDYKELSKLDIYAVDNEGDEDAHSIDESLYISDIYMDPGKGMESMVRKYDKAAFFITNSYINVINDTDSSDSDSEDQNELDNEYFSNYWHEYFIKLGVNSDSKDIIFNSVLPNLADIKEKNIVSLLASYYDYFHEDDVWDSCLSQLRKINVVVRGGENSFRPLKDVLFNDCYAEEPFPYLPIDNEIATFYHNDKDVMRLLREIVDESKSNDNPNIYCSFKSIDEWKTAKLDWYLKLQTTNSERLEHIHIQFIQDLAEDFPSSNTNVYAGAKIREIKLLGNDGKMYMASKLTEGSAYGPRCKFEEFGLNLLYVSNEYLSSERVEAKTFHKLFTVMGVIYDIQKDHYAMMSSNYDFAVYFWTEYLTQFSNRTHITAIGIDELNKSATIPTSNEIKREVKSPNQLYSQSLIQSGYVKNKVSSFEDKMPLESIFSTDEVKAILKGLDFASSLSFEDCLDCLLHTKDKAMRRVILVWLSTKHSVGDEAVKSYLNKENSLWRNGKGEFVRLSELLVIDINATRIRQLFGKNAKVLSSEYIDSDLVFESFCNIFHISPITEDDFVLSPEKYDESTTATMRNQLRLPLLITAAVSDTNEWETLYEGYCELLEALEFNRCKSITFDYNNILKDSSIQFYMKDKSFFFVEDWMGRRVFKDLINEFIEYFEIDVDRNVLEAIFEADKDNYENIIERYVSYEITNNNDFVEVLNGLNETIASHIHSIVEDKDDADVDDYSSFGENTKNEVNDSPETEIAAGGSYRQADNYVDNPLDDEAEQENDDTSAECNEAESSGIDDSEITSNSSSDKEPDEEFIKDDYFDIDNTFEALEHDDLQLTRQDFINATLRTVLINGVETQYVCEHYRCGTWVRGHMRSGYWVEGYWRSGSTVSEHTRNVDKGHTQAMSNDQQAASEHCNPVSNRSVDEHSAADEHHTKHRPVDETPSSQSSSATTTKGSKPRSEKPVSSSEGNHSYTDMSSWQDKQRKNTTKQPKPFSPEDVRNFGPHGITRTLEVLEPTTSEVDEINRLLGEDLSAGQVADQNYLAQLRLYNNLKEKGLVPEESKADFVRNGHLKNEHTLGGGKYIHKCSAAGGIMYLSPSIWNKIADDRCVVCVYLGAKANQFMYFNSLEEILKWIGEDDIVIKLTGEEKADVVDTLYSGVLDGVKGTAYTLIRINSNEKYNSIFAPLATNETEDGKEDLDEY